MTPIPRDAFNEYIEQLPNVKIVVEYQQNLIVSFDYVLKIHDIEGYIHNHSVLLIAMNEIPFYVSFDDVYTQYLEAKKRLEDRYYVAKY